MTQTLPDRAMLRAAYDAVVREIDNARVQPMLTNAFYAKTADSVFAAGWSALHDFLAAQTSPDGVKPTPRLSVVSVPAGGGKTTFALAMIAALVRVTEGMPDGPMGCLFLTDQKERADKTYRDLVSLLSRKHVAIWTQDHDPRTKPSDRTKVADPAAKHSVHELARYPVVVTTHAFYKDVRGEMAREQSHKGHRRPRALTIVDERPNEVKVYEVVLSQAEAVREFIQGTDDAETVGPHIATLVRFMQDRSHYSRDLEKPSDAEEVWSVSNDLWWYTTAEAEQYARSLAQKIPTITPVFGFARSVAEGYAFIARGNGGKGITRFIGYRSDLVLTHGMMLLDATADIDGMQQVCPWRVMQETPRARYDNLEIVHVQSPTRQKLSTYFQFAKNRAAYVKWMHQTIVEHMQPDQRGLIVCKKTLFDNDNIAGRKATTPIYYLDIKGRKLAATHWGHGIGSNDWQDVDVVFLFDEFYKPRRALITDAQALQGHKSTEGALATMRTQNSKAEKVDALSEGHLLRWTKQMCLRGRARRFDEHGVCGSQKLVCSGDQQRLLRNKETLFPGASVMLCNPHKGADQKCVESLLAIFSDPKLPNEVSTNFVGDQLRKPWRELSGVIKPKAVQDALAALGWRYVSKRGRGGARFERITKRGDRQAA